MPLHNIDLLIDQADYLLTTAANELDRAEEDVSAHNVCYNSRQAIVNYLTSFLLRNGIEIAKPVSIASLTEQCREEDARFDFLEINQIYCDHENNEGAYCLNLDKVKECHDIATMARTIVVNDSPNY